MFVPLSLAGGLIGNILREFAFSSCIFSTLMSLFVSFFTPCSPPVLLNYNLNECNNLGIPINLHFENNINKLIALYGKILEWAFGAQALM